MSAALRPSSSQTCRCGARGVHGGWVASVTAAGAAWLPPPSAATTACCSAVEPPEQLEHGGPDVPDQPEGWGEPGEDLPPSRALGELRGGRVWDVGGHRYTSGCDASAPHGDCTLPLAGGPQGAQRGLGHVGNGAQSPGTSRYSRASGYRWLTGLIAVHRLRLTLLRGRILSSSTRRLGLLVEASVRSRASRCRRRTEQVRPPPTSPFERALD